MALWQYASTEETTNSCRVSRVLIDPCTDQIRDVLRHHIPPANFPQVIRQQKHKLPKLTKPQFDLILPRSGHYTGNYSDFDISLLYTLLRNICNIPTHSKGWGKDPDPIDMSLSANIERIRNARNTAVGHMTSSSLSNADFNYIWSSIRKVVVEIDKFLNNNQKYEKAVDDLRNETMDPEKDKEFESMLRDQVEEDTETRKMIEETNKTYKDQKERFEQFKNDSTARQDTTDTELHYVKHKIDEYESKTATLQDQQDDMKIDIENLKQLTEAKEPLQNEEPNVTRLKERLMEEALQIPLSEITEDSDKLPIEHLFSSVVIRKDIKKKHEGRRAPQATANEGKELKSPEDMLTKNGNPVPYVFMLGKAAHGKTTYCKWLLKTWCKTKGLGVGGRPLNKWEEGLKQFDFVFHIPLRNVDRSRANVTEMICQDILGSDTDLKATAQHVLSSKKYRCFIMMDGLDEWKPDQSVIDRLKYKGMPNIDCMSNCVIFTTMRPWKFSEVAGVLRNNARVIEIQGLDDKGIESVIEKVLVHYYELELDTIEYKAKYKEIIQNLENATLKSFIQIPLLAVVCVQIWYEGEQRGDSMTSFYIAMVNMLIERAHLKHDTQKLILEAMNYTLPKVMTGKKNLKDYFNVFLKLGKVAYEGLLSKGIKLVFQKDDLETEIGERELQFALDVGLVSQRDEHSTLEKKVSVQFFHKSVQEFLAAIYIVTIKEVSDSFCENLCYIVKIVEWSNVIMFICGMCPILGSVISQHVVRLKDSDTSTCEYRLMSKTGQIEEEYSPTTEDLYKEQVNWYRELQYRHTDSPVTFHISDVCLSNYKDRETVRLTREILSNNNVVDIRSLNLDKVSAVGEYGISNTVVNNFLSDNQHTRSLVMVNINGDDTGRCINIIHGSALRALGLNNVLVSDSDTVHGPVLSNCNKLQYLRLKKVPLADREIGLTSSMSMLERIILVRVDMTQAGWGRWLQSVIDINHQFDVILINTNIDKDTRSTINRSPHFSLNKREDYIWYERKVDDDWLHFTRVQSQAQGIHSMSCLESLSHLSQRQNEYNMPEFTRLRTQIHDTSIDRHSRSSLQSSSHFSERESDYDWLDFTRGHSQTPESDTRCCSYTCILL